MLKQEKHIDLKQSAKALIAKSEELSAIKTIVSYVNIPGSSEEFLSAYNTLKEQLPEIRPAKATNVGITPNRSSQFGLFNANSNTQTDATNANSTRPNP